MNIYKIGEKVKFNRVVERYPHVLVEKGETGTVDFIDGASIGVKLDRKVEGLDEWDNCVIWNEDTDDGCGNFTDYPLDVAAILRKGTNNESKSK